MGWEMKDIKKNWHTLISLVDLCDFHGKCPLKVSMPHLEFKCKQSMLIYFFKSSP